MEKCEIHTSISQDETGICVVEMGVDFAFGCNKRLCLGIKGSIMPSVGISMYVPGSHSTNNRGLKN